jgi:lipid-A-disaccharide synthase-like uncharacterized protein
MMLDHAISVTIQAATTVLMQTAPSQWAVIPQDVDSRWLAAGLGAQAAIALCLLIHVLASRRHNRFVIPKALAWLSTAATLVLMVYAASRQDLVFTLGQFVHVLLWRRLLGWLHRPRPEGKSAGPRALDEEDSRFPMIAPHQAERRIKPRESGDA